MTNSEIAQRFADGYERGNSGNMFIEGDTIYSYGYHFAIARRVCPGVLVTTRTYSSTTAKHVSHVRHALRYHTVVRCYDPKGSHDLNLTKYLKEIEVLVGKLSKARKPEIWKARIQDVCKDAIMYCDWFKVSLAKLDAYLYSENYKPKNK